MKARDMMDWLAGHDRDYGFSSLVEADTIAEAEAYVGRYPTDERGFRTCATIPATVDSALEMLSLAGYTWTGKEGHRTCNRGGFTARVTTRDRRDATIFIGTSEGMTASAAGAGGFLHHGDRPEI